jgi:hypothetical protein
VGLGCLPTSFMLFGGAFSTIAERVKLDGPNKKATILVSVCLSFYLQQRGPS